MIIIRANAAGQPRAAALELAGVNEEVGRKFRVWNTKDNIVSKLEGRISPLNVKPLCGMNVFQANLDLG